MSTPENRLTEPVKEYTYRDPYLSLWQSAVKKVEQDRAQREGFASVSEEELESPIHTIHSLLATSNVATAESIMFAADTREGAVTDCAGLLSKFLWAEITRNHKKAQEYKDALDKSICDAKWASCLEQYLAYKTQAQEFIYRENQDMVFPIENICRIAILGDWGTGERPAENVLVQAKSQKPDLLLHLGDIYYSGTHEECKANFLDLCGRIFGHDFPLYTLCGNHDMYSGGRGYYDLLDAIGQHASYFCLRNNKWQLLAMDTGHNDCNPLTVNSNITSLTGSELAWHRKHIENPEGRRTILFSHHQLFSPFGSVGEIDGKHYQYNPNLFSAFGDLLDRVEWWFWGHEHVLAVYDSYLGLKRGRCVGSSAVPVFLDQQSYTLRQDLVTRTPSMFPSWNRNAEAGNDGRVYDNAFAILELNGDNATVQYFDVPVGRNARLIYSE